MTTLSARAAVIPRERSEMTARPRTMPAAPPSPWKKRATSRKGRLGARAEQMLAARASTLPHRRRGLRPNRSDRTPMPSCPSAMPTRKVVIVSWTLEAETPRSSAIWPKAGR